MSAVIQNTLSLLDQGLIGRFRRDCHTDWMRFTQHRFVRELATGTLDKKEFKQFLIQDYLYLLDYCRMQALAIYKSNDLEEMHYFSSLLQGLLNIEIPLHISYCQEWGINQKDLEKTPRTIELIAYSQYLLNKSMQGDLLDLIVLLAPCLVGYGEIGLKLLIDSKTNQQNNPYQSWINLYAGADYLELLKDTLSFLDQMGKKYGVEQRYAQLSAKFKTAVKLEAAFWDVGRVTSL